MTLPLLPRSASGITHALADRYVEAACFDLGLGFMHITDSRKQRSALGWPDYTISGGKIIFREYKSPGDSLRPDQRWWRDQILAAGGDWRTWTAELLHVGLVLRELQALAVG